MIQIRVYGGDGCEPKRRNWCALCTRWTWCTWWWSEMFFLAQWQMLLKVKEWRWLNISAVLQCLHYIAVHQIKTPLTAVKSRGYQVFSLCSYQHFTQAEWRKLSLSFLIFYFSHSDFNPLFEEISNRVGTKAPSRFTCRQSYSDPDDNQLD